MTTMPPPQDLARRFAQVRAQTDALTAALSEADCQVQSMPDASPVKWHLAHTTWFFETFVLAPHDPDFRPFDPAFRVLFNSYYNGIGAQHPRGQRGLITRPDLSMVRAWRRVVDAQMAELLTVSPRPEVSGQVMLGLQHEQQHQELILTDLLHLLSCNPLVPVYRPAPAEPVPADLNGPAWVAQPGGLVNIGAPDAGFAFDNEHPRHQAWLTPYVLARRPVSQSDWADFITDGGYGDARWWMSAGWDWVRSQQISAPAYWRRAGASWQVFGLHGLQPLRAEAPVCHVSWYEADAYARWYAAQHPDAAPTRLPTEAEWEAAAWPLAEAAAAHGNFLDEGALQPLPAPSAAADIALQQLLGDVWEWTASPYTAYPGFRPWAGAVGEYNGKFMVNQMVLRGGSCATPRSHIRPSYRNFFPTDARWQFSGLRLARDAA